MVCGEAAAHPVPELDTGLPQAFEQAGVLLRLVVLGGRVQALGGTVLAVLDAALPVEAVPEFASAGAGDVQVFAADAGDGDSLITR